MVRRIAILGLVLAVGAPLAPARASDRVAKALLDALKANGTIDAKQYDELNQLIEDEASAEAASPAVSAPPPEKPGKLDVFWKDGIRMESADGAFKLGIGGRLQNDWGVVSPDGDIRDEIPSNDAGKGTGTNWRRVRLQVAGQMYERLGAKIEIDFAGGSANLRDAYMELLKLPYAGTLRVGHFKEPFSLDELTSDSYTMFIERSLMDAFAPARNTGFMVQNAPLEQRMTWAFGAFRQTSDTTGNSFIEDATYNLTGRVTGLPWYADQGRHLLHLGLSASQRFLDGTSVAFQSIPEVKLNNPSYVDTGNIPAKSAQLVTPELALVYGPFSFQTEYTHAWVQGDGDTEDSNFNGLYAEASYFLTGESRPYKTSEGAFTRVAPEHNFDLKGGMGAWEVALRYSRIDLTDSGIAGGTLDDGTIGLNWYLNPNFRTSFNYVGGRLEDVGWTNQFVARFQVDF